MLSSPLMRCFSRSRAFGRRAALLAACLLTAGAAGAATVSDPPMQAGPGDFIDPPGNEEVDAGQEYGTAQSEIESQSGLRVLQDFSGFTAGANVIVFTDPALPAIRITPAGSISASAGEAAGGKAMSSPGPAIGLTNSPQNSTATYMIEFGTWSGSQFTPDRVVEAAAFVLTDFSTPVTVSAAFRAASGAVVFDTGLIAGETNADGNGNHRDIQIGFNAKTAQTAPIRSITITRQVGAATFVPPGGTSGLDDLAFAVQADEPPAPPVPLPEAVSDWHTAHDHVWAGDRYWANRLQDWRVQKGRLECVLGDKNKPMRTVHLLTRRTHELPGDFTMTVRTGSLVGSSIPLDAFTGFLIGAGAGLDYRAAALVHHNSGPAGGILAGMDGKGRAILRDNTAAGSPQLAVGVQPAALPAEARLEVETSPQGSGYRVHLRVKSVSGALLSEAQKDFPASQIPGSLALVSHPGSGSNGGRFWFRDWTTAGSKLAEDPARTLGPLVGAMHTLSGGIMKMTAQLAAISSQDAAQLDLEISQNGNWTTAATAPVIFPARTATFRVAGWNSAADVPYRIRCEVNRTDGSTTTHYWQGTVRHDPVEKNEILVGGLTCVIHATGRFSGVDTGTTTAWTQETLSFPHTDLMANLAKQNPDILAFTGDQIYEGGSPTKADQTSLYHSELDYLYKWYLFCWTVGNLTRDVPALCMPDDHDVFQSNLWGEGGKPTNTDSQGGYIMPTEFVNMVQRTQTAHLPDPYDPTPVQQGITVYYTAMTYGRIGFAIFEDRKWKTGPANPPPDAELELLGERQTAFLEAWARDWRGHDMKIAVSQTELAQGTTHTGFGLTRNSGDKDANGWPPARRDDAVALLRKGFALHLSGDQHLGILLQHGLAAQGDSNYSFCVPSMANAYPRAWDPQNPNDGPTSQLRNYTGDYTDNFGNKIRVVAVGNPASYYSNFSTGVAPLATNDRGPGYGLLRLDKAARTIQIESWPRFADPGNSATWRALGPGSPPVNGQYPGFPVTIRQTDNYGRAPAAYLPLVVEDGVNNPVIEVVDEASGETIYALRIAGHRFRPHVFAPGSYTVKITEPDTGYSRTLTGQTAAPFGGHEIVAFRAADHSIIRGTATTLWWDVTGSTGLSLSPGIGSVDRNSINGVGSIQVSPEMDTEYILLSSGSGGTRESRVTVRVFDDLATWRARYFSPEDLADPSKEATVWGHQANPDGDPLPNFLEFALASDPLADSTDKLPKASITVVDMDDQALRFLEVLFHEPLNIAGVSYEVEYSTDLATWEQADLATFQELGRTSAPGQTDEVRIRDTQTLESYAPGGNRVFLRFKLVVPVPGE